MQKSELREAGYAEQEKYQKSPIITAIWVVSTLAMIAFVFVFVVFAGEWKNSGSDFVDFMDDAAIWLNTIFREWTFAVYLILWALILLTLFFVTRLDLRKQKRSESPEAPKRLKRYILYSVLALLALAVLFYSLALLANISGSVSSGRSSGINFFDIASFLLNLLALPLLFLGPACTVVYLIVWEFLYLAVKLVTTIFVCHDKNKGIKLKILKGTAMPVCACAEAVSLRHILVSYLVPFVFMYSFLLLLCATSDGDLFYYFTITALFMSFFMAYDLTLVLYSAYLKIRYRPDYISINHHIYEVTLFKKSYVTNPAAARRIIAGKQTKNSQAAKIRERKSGAV